jgi:dUTPase
MYHILDVGKIVDSFSCHSLCKYTQIHLGIDVCLDDDEVIESGSVKKVKTHAAVYNIPITHYIQVEGISTNIGICSIGGVLHPDTYGYIHIYVRNTSLQSRSLPKQMKLGSIFVKPFYDCCNVDYDTMSA